MEFKSKETSLADTCIHPVRWFANQTNSTYWNEGGLIEVRDFYGNQKINFKNSSVLVFTDRKILNSIEPQILLYPVGIFSAEDSFLKSFYSSEIYGNVYENQDSSAYVFPLINLYKFPEFKYYVNECSAQIVKSSFGQNLYSEFNIGTSVSIILDSICYFAGDIDDINQKRNEFLITALVEMIRVLRYSAKFSKVIKELFRSKKSIIFLLYYKATESDIIFHVESILMRYFKLAKLGKNSLFCNDPPNEIIACIAIIPTILELTILDYGTSEIVDKIKKLKEDIYAILKSSSDELNHIKNKLILFELLDIPFTPIINKETLEKIYDSI